MSQLSSLGSILETVHSHSSRHALYLRGGKWTAGTLAAVLDPMHSENPDDVDDDPAFAKMNQLNYVLLISDVQDIVLNTLEQAPGATTDLLIEALEYYVDNDAFLDFSRG